MEPEDSMILTQMKSSPIYQAGRRAGKAEMGNQVLLVLAQKGYGHKFGSDPLVAVSKLIQLLDGR